MEFRIPDDPGQKKNTTTFNLPSRYDAGMAAFISKTSGNEKDDRDRLPTVPANKNKEEPTKNYDKLSGTGETEDEDDSLQFAMDMGGRRKSKRKSKKKKSKTKKKKKGRKKRKNKTKKKKRKPRRKSRKRRRKTKRKFRNQRGCKR